MEAYLKNLFEDSSEAKSTIKNRIGFLLSIAREVPGAKDLSFLRKEKVVLARVNDSDNVGTRYGRMVHVIKAIDMVDGCVSKKTRDRYGALIVKLKPQKQDLNDNNVMSAKQAERYMTIGQLNKIVEHAYIDLNKRYEITKLSKADLKRLITAGKIFTFAKEFQEVVLMACYVFQPSVRNNWGDLHIATSERQANKDNTKNYLLVNHRNKTMKLVMNEYKNKHSMGHQVIDLSAKLTALLFHWLVVVQTCIGQTPEYPLYYSINVSSATYAEKTDTIRKQIQRVFMKYTGKDIGINDLRHSWEKHIQSSDDYKRMTILERSELHRQLLHGYDVSQRYNLVQRNESNIDPNE